MWFQKYVVPRLNFTYKMMRAAIWDILPRCCTPFLPISTNLHCHNALYRVQGETMLLVGPPNAYKYTPYKPPAAPIFHGFDAISSI